jgi:hypothetical protein
VPDASKSAEEAAPAAPAAPAETVETDGSPEEERKLFLGGLSTVRKQGIGIGCIETAYNHRVVLRSIPALMVLRT